MLAAAQKAACASAQSLALARLEPTVGLVDDIDPTLAANNAAITVTILKRLQRVTYFHGALPLLVIADRP